MKGYKTKGSKKHGIVTVSHREAIGDEAASLVFVGCKNTTRQA